MTARPPLVVLLLTYTPELTGPRAQYARATLQAIQANLTYSGPIYLHIADDGSPEGYTQTLVKQVKNLKEPWQYERISWTNARRSGYGVSYNLATQVTHGYGDDAIILPLEDDWELREPLDVDKYIEALAEETPINCIRLGYLGFTDHLYGSVERYFDVPYIVFSPDSPERHIAAGHPRLETVAWEKQIGPWAENLNPGAVEWEWCGRLASRCGVAWPLDTPRAYWFAHVGSVQARTDQLEASNA